MDAGPDLTEDLAATFRQRRARVADLRARLAATAEAVAAVAEELARTRDLVAGTTRGDPEPLRDGARRARRFAAAERDEAARLRRARVPPDRA
ncbi:hypothetical protein [Actinomycetospora chiangmaiensis]|uniref:hypothetical protein n=1 Tax=Actinomycetospora chiangmaiensis TaxID=402650 RepID=UPI00037DDF01|nr:hypothetical protein [Actinomycetospora chiangmaiensis]